MKSGVAVKTIFRRFSPENFILFLVLILSVVTACLPSSIQETYFERDLFNCRVAEFRNSKYVIGGYYKRDHIKLPDAQIFEIKDPREWCYYKKRIKPGDYYRGVSVKGLTPAVSLKGEIIIPADAEFIQFNDRLYMIGGDTGETGGGDVSYTVDLRIWNIVLQDAPWKTEKVRRGHKLAVFRGSLLLAGGDGFSDIWKSENGIDWIKCEFQCGGVRDLFVFKERLFILGRYGNYNHLYSTADGSSWTEEIKFPGRIELEIFTNDSELLAASRNSIYTSPDGSQWKSVISSSALTGIQCVINNKIYASEIQGLKGLSFSTDCINWESAETGERISLLPYDTGGDTLESADYFSIVEFKNKGWLIGGSPDSVFSSSDGLHWARMKGKGEKRFLQRSKGAVYVINDHIHIAGGVWRGQLVNSRDQVSIVLGDIWRSRDGLNWESAAQDAAWGRLMNMTSVSIKGRVYLFGGEQYGENGDPGQVWGSSDGVKWENLSGHSKKSLLADSDIRNDYIGTAILNNRIYLSDKYTGSDFYVISDGKNINKLKGSGDAKNFGLRLRNCVTISTERGEFLILKRDEEFFITSDFNVWEKPIYNFTDHYKGDESIKDYTLFKIGERLFLVKIKTGERIEIESIAMTYDIKNLIITFSEYKKTEFGK